MGFDAIKAANPASRWLISLAEPILSFAIEGFLGMLVEKGVLVIDLTMDGIRQGRTKDEWVKDMDKYYSSAMARVYTEEEKNEIRKAYLTALGKYGTVGVQQPKNT